MPVIYLWFTYNELFLTIETSIQESAFMIRIIFEVFKVVNRLQKINIWALST
jgi:hypothetical protein